VAPRGGRYRQIASSPILNDNTTSANRAVNIPEFVSMSADGMESIEVHIVDEHR